MGIYKTVPYWPGTSIGDVMHSASALPFARSLNHESNASHPLHKKFPIVALQAQTLKKGVQLLILTLSIMTMTLSIMMTLPILVGPTSALPHPRSQMFVHLWCQYSLSSPFP